MRTPKAPSHLDPKTREWWRTIATTYELDSHHYRILQAACESWDRAMQARSIIDSQGLTFTDKFGQPKMRPEVLIERDNRAAFLRAVRELDLDAEPPSEHRRPPAIRSNRG